VRLLCRGNETDCVMQMGLSLGAGYFEPPAGDVRRRAPANIGGCEGLRRWPPRTGEGAASVMATTNLILVRSRQQHLVLSAALAAADRSGGYSRAIRQPSMSPSASATMRSLYLCCAMHHFSPIQRANLPPVILSAAAMVIDDGVEATVATAPATKLAVSPAPMRSPSSLVLMPMAEL
jgi:hypothetical protein